MGHQSDDASQIFSKHLRFGLHEKYYRDMAELQSSFKFMVCTAREFIAVDPEKTTVAIATCGGITPGINCVLRSLVKCLDQQYKVKKIFGVRMGMYGLMQSDDKYWLPLKAADVSGIQSRGGSFLGTDKVRFDANAILENLSKRGINQLYVIGGQGTHKALKELNEAV